MFGVSSFLGYYRGSVFSPLSQAAPPDPDLTPFQAVDVVLQYIWPSGPLYNPSWMEPPLPQQSESCGLDVIWIFRKFTRSFPEEVFSKMTPFPFPSFWWSDAKSLRLIMVEELWCAEDPCKPRKVASNTGINSEPDFTHSTQFLTFYAFKVTQYPMMVVLIPAILYLIPTRLWVLEHGTRRPIKQYAEFYQRTRAVMVIFSSWCWDTWGVMICKCM